MSFALNEKAIGNLIPPAHAYDPGAAQIAFAPGRLSSDLACHRLSSARLGYAQSALYRMLPSLSTINTVAVAVVTDKGEKTAKSIDVK